MKDKINLAAAKTMKIEPAHRGRVSGQSFVPGAELLHAELMGRKVLDAEGSPMAASPWAVLEMRTYSFKI